MAKLKRTFFPGDEWLYFKIYTGIKTADTITATVLLPLIQKLRKEKLISKWFFLRYADPNFHIRFRVFVPDKEDLGKVLVLCNHQLKNLCKEEMIYKIELSTYHREIERYGAKEMEISEEIFSIDSDCVLSLLTHFRKKDENYRWRVGLKLVDGLLGDMGYDLARKSECMERMSSSFKTEFGYNMYNAKQLNAIYRDRRKQIDSSLEINPEDEDLIKADQLIGKRSREMKKLASKQSLPDQNITSYVHMCMNRLFRSQNRKHELLIYDFLSRHYKSELARTKHQK